jgi:adenylate kinase
MPEGIIPDHATKMVFVLRCNPKVLERRLRGRKWESRKVRENVMAEILDSCLIAAQNNYAKQKITQLDTSHASIRNSVLLARRILLGARPPKSPIDWLGRLEKDNSFSKYLRW